MDSRIIRNGFLFLAFLFQAFSVFADIPRETLERLAEIKVELQEIHYLSAADQLTRQEYLDKKRALDSETRALWKPYSRLPRDEQREAKVAIDGIANANLALLKPQWEKALAAYREEQKQTEARLAADLDADARAAAEWQRQRLLLQQQGGSPAADAKAMAEISQLREKYQTLGGSWPRKFDERLALLTKAVADNPSVPLASPQVRPASETPGQQAPDFDTDVKLASSIAVRQMENQLKYEKKQISPDAFREGDIVYNRDMAALASRYRAISAAKAQEFESAYKRMASAELQALRAQYNPGKFAQQKTITVSLEKPKPSKGNSFLPVLGIVAGTVLIGGFVFLVFRGKGEDKGPPLTVNFGSARWEPQRDRPASPDCVVHGVMFGKSGNPDLSQDHPGTPIVSTAESHTLIVARTRAGKGTRVVVPTLLRYGGSMLVIDPKGENAAVTARTRRDQLGQKVHIVNPWGELESHYAKLGFSTATFNPLDAIERNNPKAVAVAQSLATIICPPRDSKDSYWQGSAANVLAGVLLWLADEPTEQKTLARAREIVTMSRKDFRQILTRMMASTAYHGAVREMVSQYIDLADETYGGIMSNLAENTKFLSDPLIKHSTGQSSFSMNDLLDDLSTIYLVIPHDRIATHATWLRLMIAAAMQGIKSRDKTIRPKHRCMFMIDEFGSIGRIPDVPRDIALMSGYGLDFTLIVQGLDQLKDHYGDAKETILSNCGYKWFCNVSDLSTAKYLSDSLGKQTVRTTGQSTSSGQSQSGQSTGESVNYGETGRSLLNPDEILNLGRDTAILLAPESRPHYLNPVDYWRLPQVFANLEKEYPRLYWQPPLQFDPNPYVHSSHSTGNSKSENGDRERNQSGAGMSIEEARETLGVDSDATREEIIAAYKRLMGRVHPDKGGSNHFAKKLNEARKALITHGQKSLR